MANPRNTAVVEDCPKAIDTVGEWDARGRTVSDIATQMRAATFTTSSLVRRLGEEGLVEHERYGALEHTVSDLLVDRVD